MKNNCHVKKCTGSQDKCNWHPQIQTVICLCEDHNNLPDDEKNNIIIDLDRAKKDYDSAMDSLS